MGRGVLSKAVKVKVEVSQMGDEFISIGVDGCPHNTGSHGHQCKASHPGQDKVGAGVFCPYVLDLPHAMDIARF